MDREKIVDALRALDRELEKEGISRASVSRRAGYNSGTLTQALKYAEEGKSVIKVDRLLALYEAAGRSLDPSTLQFSEEAAEWAPLQMASPEQGAEKLMEMARKEAPNVRHPLLYPVPDRMARAFGLPLGAVLIIDEEARPRSRDLVLATIVDVDTGSAASYLGRFAPPYLIGPAIARSPHDLIVVDDSTVWIKGPVVATLRPDG